MSKITATLDKDGFYIMTNSLPPTFFASSSQFATIVTKTLKRNCKTRAGKRAAKRKALQLINKLQIEMEEMEWNRKNI